ncbi:hypothetical protein R3P38DRAFT_3353547 [Favolaschia claudopus]|uniref:DUF6532 domain-containing protein n=1 Tax=Favolaschia claudopus TaxID=2862362 RepID=A0AAW0BRQ7_9AGAR
MARTDSDNENIAPAQARRARASRDSEALPTPPPRSRAPSKKQAAQEEDEVAALEKKMEALKKQLALKKVKAAKESRAARAAQEKGDQDLESEESMSEDDNPFPASSVIKPLGPLPIPNTPTPPVFRKVAQKEPKTKPRKFLAVVQTSPSEPDGMSPPPSPKSAEEPENLFDDEASSPPSRKRANSGTSSPPPAKRTKQQYEEAPFRDGFVAVRGAKPMAGDYADIPHAIIIRACREFTGRIVGVYMLPGAGLQDQWAQECFRTACGVAKCHYAYTERIGKIIKFRGSQVRGKTISTFRTLLASAHGFERSTSGKVIAANRRKAAKLLTNSAFHYKEPEAKPLPVGFAENKIIAQVRKATTFLAKDSVGIVFPNYFNPISLENIAMELTALEFCVKEWSTGSLVVATFSEKATKDSYEKHLKDVKKWSALKPAVVENLRKKWYRRASETLVSDITNDAESGINDAQEEALLAELDGRTGETDSEDEGNGGDEDEVNGDLS